MLLIFNLTLRKILIIIITLSQISCAFSPLMLEEKKSANLMPDSVALNILRKYNLGEDIYLTEPPVCGGGRVLVPVTDLTAIIYFKKLKRVILRRTNFLCMTGVFVNNVESEAEARELLLALRSLGATKLDEIKVMGF